MTCLSNKEVKTRKPHKCWGCTKEYPANSAMEVVTCVDSGEISKAYWCQNCITYLNKYRNDVDPYNDGFSYGELKDIIEEVQG